MSGSSDEGGNSSNSTCRSANGTSLDQKRYKGIRCRKWGKWVSEIRVPGTHDRLWLGTYSTPEGAAVAHDVATYCFRGPASVNKLNFPAMLPAMARTDLSPRSVQKAASDAGMAMDAQFIASREMAPCDYHLVQEGEALSISVDDYL